MAMILLYANADINSRVASTCPLYYWALAALIEEYQQNKLSHMGAFIVIVASLHNVVYMCLNFFLFPSEAGFV